MKILLLNGPNLNMLGTREPEKYGNLTLADIESKIMNLASKQGVEIETFQSNHEGEIIDKIQATDADGMIINAGGFTHTSVAIRDAISSKFLPTVEVHMTNIHAREEFRHQSLISGVSIGQVVGFKEKSYEYALFGLIDYIKNCK